MNPICCVEYQISVQNCGVTTKRTSEDITNARFEKERQHWHSKKSHAHRWIAAKQNDPTSGTASVWLEENFSNIILL